MQAFVNLLQVSIKNKNFQNFSIRLTFNENWLNITYNGLAPLAKNVVILLRLTAVAAAAGDASIQKELDLDFMIKSKDSGTTALIFLNKEMEDIMKIAKYL